MNLASLADHLPLLTECWDEEAVTGKEEEALEVNSTRRGRCGTTFLSKDVASRQSEVNSSSGWNLACGSFQGSTGQMELLQSAK